MDEWSDRKIAMHAIRRQYAHEIVCSNRWGLLIWLVTGCLGGIGLIVVGLMVNLLTGYMQTHVH